MVINIINQTKSRVVIGGQSVRLTWRGMAPLTHIAVTNSSPSTLSCSPNNISTTISLPTISHVRRFSLNNTYVIQYCQTCKIQPTISNSQPSLYHLGCNIQIAITVFTCMIYICPSSPKILVEEQQYNKSIVRERGAQPQCLVMCQYTICNIQYTIYTFLFIRCTMYDMQHTIYNINMYNVWYAIYNKSIVRERSSTTVSFTHCVQSCNVSPRTLQRSCK